MKWKWIFFLAVSLFSQVKAIGQTGDDSLKSRHLEPVTIHANRLQSDIDWLSPIQGTFIFSGKKTDVVILSQKNMAVAEKYGRQIFAKIPGVFVYDMDGTGNQLNVSSRGLDPHRSWEFNIRKDGILTNSDMYGYPASHYNIPMEAVERIEIVRGTGALQYGAQFGGMMNMISKQPDSTRKFAFENISTVGSYDLMSTYNAVSGKIGKFRYSAWMHGKRLTGYRDNSSSRSDAEAISLFYDASPRLHFKLEWTHSNYITQLAGPLTDSMFHQKPNQATRARNYYNPDIHIPSLTVNWNPSEKTQFQFTASLATGARNSVLFDKPATVADTILASTKEFSNRQVDIDNFNSLTTEFRMLHHYTIAGQKNTISAGIQGMNNDLHRRQQGKGTTGSDFDLTNLATEWGRDLRYKTRNLAIFAENQWELTHRFSINAGFRIETGETKLSGTITKYPAGELPNVIKHQFPLLGISTQFALTESINLYGGWSQAYRPVILKDIIPQSVYEVSDKNLKDASGYVSEIGCRGKWKFLRWDVTAFYLRYNKRMGTLAQTDSAGGLQIYRTNIGDSHTAGIELFVQGDFRLGEKSGLSLFTSTSFMDARYQNASVKSGNENVNINGNKVESLPSWISRNGLTFSYASLRVSVLHSYTSESFADALNSKQPSVSGATGLVPSYYILDLNFSVQILPNLKLSGNLNNLLNTSYYTKRPQFYPGPGIWPSDGRTYSATVTLQL